MNFTDDVREAGLLFEEYGYKINALPIKFGKFTNHLFPSDGYLKNFPASNLKDNYSVILNHYLSDTVAIDVDDYKIINILFEDVGISLDNLIENTMSWYGDDNRCKLIFKKQSTDITLNSASLKPWRDHGSILTLKGYRLPVPVNYLNLSNFFDLLPPSWHPPQMPKWNSSHIIPYKRYQFITRPYRYNELPVIPDSITDIWTNFDLYKKRFTDLVFRYC